MNSVLVLAYDFPPRGGGAVLRTVKFIKYLPEFGWHPIVIAPEWESSTPSNAGDAGLAAEVSAAETIRAGWAPHRPNGWLTRATNAVPGAWRLRLLLKRQIAFPDAMAPWVREALPVARQIIDQRPIHVIYSTSPPVSAHLLAYRIRQFTNLPWIADFRDPWVGNALLDPKKGALRKARDRAWERRVVESADFVIANTRASQKAMRQRYDRLAKKISVITNGYDEEDFADVRATRSDQVFTICYAGSAYHSYTPEAFLPVLRGVLKAVEPRTVEFRVAGSCCEWIERRVSDPVLRAHTRPLGTMPHSAIPELLASSHVLLHVYPRGLQHQVPGKLYEYLRSGTPILSLCDIPSETHRLLQETGAGWAYLPSDTNSITQRLLDLYSQWRRGEWSRLLLQRQPCIQEYDRRHLTQQLASVLDTVTR